jgi:hypothetical protein
MDKATELRYYLKQNPELLKKVQESIPETETVEEETLTFNGVQESWGGYVKICKVPSMPGEEETEKKIVKKPITNFVIEPVQLIVSDDSTELKAFIKYNFQKIPITLTANNFASPRDFKNAIGAILGPSAGWFDGKQSELTGIQRIIDSKEVKRIRGAKSSGFNYVGKNLVYVTSKGSIDSSCKAIDSIALLESSKAIDNQDIIKENPATVEDLKALKSMLFAFNDLGITTLFIGYICALFLKERMWQELGEKFPHMAVIGASGSGKSQTYESIGAPILNMSKDQQQAAKQATPFTTLKNGASTNTAPFVINEYKSNKLPQYRIDEIDNLLNNSYDRYQGERGQANQTIRIYNYCAPIIIIGESFNADTSAVERIIRIYLNREESAKYTESFFKLKSMDKRLKKLGKSLLLEALKLPKETLENWNKGNMDILNNTSIHTSRGRDNLSKVFAGLDLLRHVYFLAGLEFDDVMALKCQAFERYQADTLEGNATSKSAVGEILEAIDQLAYKQLIIKDRHFTVLDRSNELALDIKSIYEVLEKEYVSRKNTLSLSQAEFTRLLVKESFFNTYKPVKLVPPGTIENTKKPRKSYVLNIQSLRETGLELNSLVTENPIEEYEQDDIANLF